MTRGIARTRLRHAASVTLAMLAWLASGTRSLYGQASLADRLTDCGDAIACEDGGCVGSGAGYCGNLVTPAGGCASGMEMFWFRGDYVLWQRNGVHLPPLITASPAGTDPSVAGIVGEPATEILAGSREVIDGARSGFALEMGVWLNAHTGWAVVGDYFNGGRDSYGLVAGPEDDRILARPLFDVQENRQSALLTNLPGELEGTVRLSVFDDFQGAGFAMQRRMWASGNACTSEGGASITGFGGYRYYHHDSLVYNFDNFLALEDNTLNIPDNTDVFIQDKFASRSEFHGLEFGAKGRIQRCHRWIEGMAAVAFGPTRRTVFVEGGEIDVLANGSAAAYPGGRYTSELTNLGTYEDDEFQVIPRLRLGGGWQITERLGFHFGYNIIVWDGIVQAAHHLPFTYSADDSTPTLAVDIRNLNPASPGGSDAPAFPRLRDTTMFAHGLDFGLELWF